MDKLSNMIDRFLLTRTWYVIQWLFIMTVAFDLIFYSYGFWTKLFYLAGLAAGFSNIKEWHKKHIYSVKRKHWNYIRQLDSCYRERVGFSHPFNEYNIITLFTNTNTDKVFRPVLSRSYQNALPKQSTIC